MKMTAKRFRAFVLTINFTVLNLLHIIFPIWLIKEDVMAGTMKGTGIEMAVLAPWMLEAISIPFVLGQIIYYLVHRKDKHFYLLNTIVFALYIFQVLLFNILLWF